MDNQQQIPDHVKDHMLEYYKYSNKARLALNKLEEYFLPQIKQAELDRDISTLQILKNMTPHISHLQKKIDKSINTLIKEDEN